MESEFFHPMAFRCTCAAKNEELFVKYATDTKGYLPFLPMGKETKQDLYEESSLLISTSALSHKNF
jgi:hypothetical protein